MSKRIQIIPLQENSVIKFIQFEGETFISPNFTPPDAPISGEVSSDGDLIDASVETVAGSNGKHIVVSSETKVTYPMVETEQYMLVLGTDSDELNEIFTRPIGR